MNKLKDVCFVIIMPPLFAVVSPHYIYWALTLNYTKHIILRSIIAIAPFVLLYLLLSNYIENDKLNRITGYTDTDYARFGYDILPWFIAIMLLIIQGIFVWFSLDTSSKSYLPIFMFTLIQTANDLYQKIIAYRKRNAHIYKPSTSQKLIIDSNYGEIQISTINQEGSNKTSFEKDIVISLNSNIGPISLVLSQQKNHSSKKH